MLNCILDTINYIEDHIDSSLEIDELAKVACLSRYHFQRMFHTITGFTLGEYIRNRRLSLAAEELYSNKFRISDIALKYGYDSPDAFTKAFHRLHGTTPSSLKRGNIRLKSFPKLIPQIPIRSDFALIYRVVEKKPINVFGSEFITTSFEATRSKEILDFCDRLWDDGTHQKINQILGMPKMNLLYGIHYDFKENGSRRYMMGWDMPKEGVPTEFNRLEIPALTWAIFEASGKIEERLVIEKVWKRIYYEWFPSSGFEQVDGPCFEKYMWTDKEYHSYSCEVWIPVIKRR